MLQSPRPQHVLEHGPPHESGTTDSKRLMFRLRLRFFNLRVFIKE